MLYSICIGLILVASIILILAVLVQNPKSGMAANFGAANQTMGVRQTTDFLEKFTWAMIAAIVFFCLLAATATPSTKVVKDHSTTATEQAVDEMLEEINKTEEINLENVEGTTAENAEGTTAENTTTATTTNDENAKQ